MVSSGRQIIAPLLLLLSAIVFANAQPAVDKGSTATISGKVTLGDKGVSGLVVGLITNSSTGTHVTHLKAVTDEDGNYRIKNVPPNTYQMTISALQYVLSDGRQSVTVGKNEVVENINITLIRGGVITGKVTDADGRPVVEEQINLSSITPSNAASPFRIIRTDDRGVYRAFGLAPGRYTVAAGKHSMSSYARAEAAAELTYHPGTVNAAEATAIEVKEGSEATDVDITLGRQLPKYAARGRIIDGETSQPLANAGIGLKFFFGVGGSTSSDAATVSTKDGEFKIENLPPGKYAVYLDARSNSEQFSEDVRFEVIDQDVDGLIIKTSKGASVSGVVVFEGSRDPSVTMNLAGYQISAFISDSYHAQTNINSDQSFRLTGLPPGRLILRLAQTRNNLQIVRIERDGVGHPRGLEIKEREQITGLRVGVSQANGKIRGVLKLPEGLALPATAQLLLYVRRTDDPAVYNSPPALVNARGQFLMEGLIAGTYEFNVVVIGVPDEQRPKLPRPTQTVVVTNGEIADVTITLQMPNTGP